MEVRTGLKCTSEHIKRGSTCFFAMHEAGASSDDILDLATDKNFEGSICKNNGRSWGGDHCIGDDDADWGFMSHSANEFKSCHFGARYGRADRTAMRHRSVC
ncbi:hypothetical protein MKK53_00395 [Methylobacterium sp. J-076]|nr:hypothetical protein [Methylobacterium sp. J-076]MCJ2010992.1 hypothetical protein [Methylobacterium sp. J-076]